MNENKMGIMPVNKLLRTMAAPMVLSMLIGALLSRYLGEKKQKSYGFVRFPCCFMSYYIIK